MEVKVFEIRDNATAIAALAIKPRVTAPDVYSDEPPPDAVRRYGGVERVDVIAYLNGKCGFPEGHNAILFTYLAGRGAFSADPYDHSNTMRQAHAFVIDHWDKLVSGDVIDLRVVRGERDEPATSDAFYSLRGAP